MSIPSGVLDVQREASDPRTSAWVSANAGSGKTHVLAQRVTRLLLAGTSPEKILCLTYTKAAAANMANRVFETLGKWTGFSDAELDKAIGSIEGRKPGARERERARRLFAQALDTPGGLKVQTIHAFCTRLLHQFPFEADVAARFEVLEERAQSELIDRQRMNVLLEAAADPDSDLGRALSTAITFAADVTFSAVVAEAIARRDEITAWIAAAGGIRPAIDGLSRALGVDPAETREGIAAEFLSGSLIAASEWPAFAAAFARGSKTDNEQAVRFASLAGLIESERLDAYLSIFCTKDLARRSSIATKKIRDDHPGLFQQMTAEQDRICDLLARRRAVETRDRTAALVIIAAAVIARVRAEKDRRGLLDYDDLIDKTLRLLGNVSSQWVHYKLDLGIDHVLIDEAQDTSPKQWEIITRLVAEFAAGLGAREINRSIFAVGDEKQSIFSFQGAAPKQFDEMQKQFAGTYRKAEIGFSSVRFKYSFRSAPVVLDAVDTVFARPQAHAGLTAVAEATVHEAVRAQAPGQVELWPMIAPDEKREIEGWDAPFDTESEVSPRVVLARRIAKTVKRWIGRLRVGDGKERHALKAGDVLILVRQRGSLFEAVISALKREDVAVAGADRLILTEHIAVMDLMVLADALLLPNDDLALATVLKSPLFGLTDDQLFALAHARGRKPLRVVLREKAGEDAMFADAAARLDRYAEWARHDTPFAFYARMLGPERGRAKFLARLGPEAADALDEFMEHALIHERSDPPTLQGFVAWLRAGSTEVKRDMDIGRDEVRVMTVHGAKGLEAPLVILADTTTPPKGPREPRLLTLPGEPGMLVWAGRKADDVPVVATARAAAVLAAEEEYRRLLYVAMTRAADRLVVAGSRGENKPPEGCWYQLVEDALKGETIEVEADDGESKVLRWRRSAPDDLEGTKSPRDETLAMPLLPPWISSDAPAEEAVRVITPSSAAEPKPFVKSDGKALKRGSIVHRLLQALPAIPPERRAEAARQHVARVTKDEPFTEAERDAMTREVLAILDDARFGALFAPGSRAEMPIIGRLAREGRAVPVSGQVDRLAVTADAVLIADYKTDRAAPRRVDNVPEPYVRQLALYRAVLATLYPDKQVRAALVWTAVPDLMEVPAAMLDAALSRVA